MSTELATQHADSLAASIQARIDAGYPFGLVDSDSGEWVDVDDVDLTRDDLEEDYDMASGIDYLSDVLDIQYLVTSDREYRHARILIGFGGPNVWIDTRTGQLEVTWWSETVRRDLPSEFIDGLDDALSELYSC